MREIIFVTIPKKLSAYGSPRHTERALYPLSYGKTHGKQDHFKYVHMSYAAVMIRNDESLFTLGGECEGCRIYRHVKTNKMAKNKSFKMVCHGVV